MTTLKEREGRYFHAGQLAAAKVPYKKAKAILTAKWGQGIRKTNYYEIGRAATGTPVKRSYTPTKYKSVFYKGKAPKTARRLDKKTGEITGGEAHYINPYRPSPMVASGEWVPRMAGTSAIYGWRDYTRHLQTYGFRKLRRGSKRDITKPTPGGVVHGIRLLLESLMKRKQYGLDGGSQYNITTVVVFGVGKREEAIKEYVSHSDKVKAYTTGGSYMHSAKAREAGLQQLYKWLSKMATKSSSYAAWLVESEVLIHA